MPCLALSLPEREEVSVALIKNRDATWTAIAPARSKFTQFASVPSNTSTSRANVRDLSARLNHEVNRTILEILAVLPSTLSHD